jgi:hypothetical protein
VLKRKQSNQGAGDDQLVVVKDAAGDGGPADHVVGEHGALRSGRVGVGVAGRDVFDTATFSQVTDRELDDGVMTVKPVHLTIEVGEERVMSPFGPQLQLLLVGQ